jgi:hypothetical protein
MPAESEAVNQVTWNHFFCSQDQSHRKHRRPPHARGKRPSESSIRGRPCEPPERRLRPGLAAPQLFYFCIHDFNSSRFCLYYVGQLKSRLRAKKPAPQNLTQTLSELPVLSTLNPRPRVVIVWKHAAIYLRKNTLPLQILFDDFVTLAHDVEGSKRLRSSKLTTT